MKGRFWTSGFTLVELMVVVVVIAILATVATASYKRYQQSARKSEGVAAVNDIRMKQETFYSTYSRYVASTDDTTVWAGAPKGGADYYGFFEWTEACPNPANAWCNLGFQPPVHQIGSTGNLMYFQFQTIGWAPGRAVPNDGGTPMIQDGTQRWLVVRARGLMQKGNPSHCTEIRHTNESTDAIVLDLSGGNCPSF